MSWPVNVSNAGLTATVVMAGLYLFSLFLAALTSRPPAMDKQDQ